MMNKTSVLGRRQKSRKLRINRTKRNKSILCSLSLALIMASTGTLGTYAYLSTQAELKNPSNIVLESGTIKSEYSKVINIEGLEPGTSKSETFKITNTGTLKQMLSLSFATDSGNQFDSQELSALEYSLSFVDKSSESIQDIKTITSINLWDYINNKKSLDLLYTDGTAVILNSNSNLECTVTVKCKDTIPESASGKTAKFNLNLTSTQITTD